MQAKRKITLYDLVFTALMAAIVFVVTSSLSLRIPTPTGMTMIKLANAFLLLSGILLGGLAAGLGSMFFDLTAPEFAAEAWITFIRFFLMGWLCGKIAWSHGANGRSAKRNLAACVAASVFSTAFYVAKGTLVLRLAGSALVPALIGQVANLATSLVNSILGIVLALVLAPVLRRAIHAAGVDRMLERA